MDAAGISPLSDPCSGSWEWRGVILTLCLFAVLDLCSVYPLFLAVKYSVLAPSPADGCKANVGQALSLILMCLLLLTHSLVVFLHLEV